MPTNPFNKAMGAALDKLRKERGLTYMQIAAELGVSYQQVQKYLKGTNAVAACDLPKFGVMLGVTVSDLYESVRINVAVRPAEPTPATDDSFLAARYVGKIADPKLRGLVVDFARKAAYQGEAA